ncbi:hypothetical protein A3A64_00440 [Candidatus Gottesmanbacteria bacterium RIFCSPLOWO2_01_FULL_48_11]|uniref:Uncharacterized protein n=1 Tax=Candidatus Gottesmanbacteria bacterium RIFCSPLOWO2_01_FULL_48_11 TaxID=1798395 RepID=A0A1F6AUJ5_9BACT|nr:MAG: hypothetical protein A3A64_00440 [Candidatus Gottesmanbacteria bacterium RIFCSPLOWO2_01_FULL_48_11]
MKTERLLWSTLIVFLISLLGVMMLYGKSFLEWFIHSPGASTDRFVFQSKIFGYKFEIGNKWELENMAAMWEIFEPNGVYEVGGIASAYTIKQITIKLVSKPVVVDNENRIRHEIYEGESKEGRLISNSTLRGNFEKQELEFFIYISPDWLKHPTKTTVGDFSNAETAGSHIASFHVATLLFESSIKNKKLIITMSRDEQLEFRTALRRLIDDWRTHENIGYPAVVKKKTMWLF